MVLPDRFLVFRKRSPNSDLIRYDIKLSG